MNANQPKDQNPKTDQGSGKQNTGTDDNQQTLAGERAKQHSGQNLRDESHSRGEQRDTDSQGHPAPQDQNQQLGREGVRQVVEGGRRGK